MKRERKILNDVLEIGVICKNNSGKKFKLLDKKRNEKGRLCFEIVFLESQNKYLKEPYDIKYGEVSDYLNLINELIGKRIKSNADGYFEVISFEKNESGVLWYNIKFENTGNTYCVRKSNLLRGGVSDVDIKELQIGEEFEQCSGDIVRIISKPRYSDDKKYQYYYIQSKFYPDFIKEVRKDEINFKRSVFNPLFPDHFGRYLGIGPYDRINYKFIYTKWYDIFERIHKNEAYLELTISKYFHNFQNFCEYCLKQLDMYDKPLWDLLEGDKDYLFFINKMDKREYSEKTYLLIPKRLNRFLTGIYDFPNLQVTNQSIYKVLNKNRYKLFEDKEEAIKYWIQKKVEEYNILFLENQSILPPYHYNILKDFNFRDSFNWYHGTNY